MKVDATTTHIPKRIILQWHITDRCNLRCRHCYQESYSGVEPDKSGLENVVEQFIELVSLWRRRLRNKHIRGHINVTGGEPFVRSDFIDLLEILHHNKRYFTYGILTNGTLIGAPAAKKIAKFRPHFVQVSVEGSAETHNEIRGPNSFNQTVRALKQLRRHRIRTFISFTAHRKNYLDFPEVARLGSRLHVTRVWADRLIPDSKDPSSTNQILTTEETKAFIALMHDARKKSRRFLFSFTDIAMHRALQFLASGQNPYACSAGDSLVTVMPNGEVYPCRRMPITAGNIMSHSLSDIYSKSDLFNALRNKKRISKGCEKCIFAFKCRGGLKCLSYALTQDPFRADPGCWLAEK